MKQPTFLEGVAVALAASLAGGILHTGLTAVSGGGALRPVVTALALGYMLYLLARSRERVGRIAAVGLWVLVTILMWLLEPPLLVFVVGHIGALLLRSLYFHAGTLAAFADLGLNAFALAAAFWALAQSGSLVLGLWSFFLVQAMFVAIPPAFPHRRAPDTDPAAADGRFRQAHRVAEAAVRRLSSLH